MDGQGVSSEQPTFEHLPSFEAGEISDTVGLGKLEAMYSELFTDVIDDGVITAEERAQLERTATALGLDRDRLRALESALQAVYELRHRVKIVEIDDAGAPSQRGSLTPIEPASDARTQALERKVAALQKRIEELEKELAEARANVAVEVDLSGIGPEPAADVGADAPTLQRRIGHDPRDVETMHALYRVHDRDGARDRAGCVAGALVVLGAANDAERAAYVAHRADGLIRPSRSLAPEAWRRLLFHPDEEVLTGEIFGVIVPAVLLGRVAALRRDKKLPALDPARKQDPAQSTLQGVRCFSWAAQILGMSAPTLYADPDFAGLVEMVPGLPPATRLGLQALSGRSPHELAFVAGRHLAWYRQERFVRLLVPEIQDLEDLFLAALVIGNPGIPLRAETKRRVSALSGAIEPLLDAVQVDRLRGAFLRFVEDGGRTNLQRWAAAADRTAARAGLLLSDDLAASAAMLELEDPATARERVDDLLVFATSDRYAQLRTVIGIAQDGPDARGHARESGQ
jgi:hypothetical protein